ncbi:hypothetical protein PAAG_08055 [Paracoccidioides lutzii Pb01]|uniref:Uncharacterized protein n=1 Tax=Paracoccidioides lutzii (strain ATCC MYA-826 / Pb01) TaxID=502779 RepID=C1HBB4_PARBA|nr:hypothetical protein PAAG_08055 [Paracoccidioides lutzii Pb01]EEH37637.2 hypothetical protein PAAG_08055 [Paracoccidioides lutzii Pb01]
MTRVNEQLPSFFSRFLSCPVPGDPTVTRIAATTSLGKRITTAHYAPLGGPRSQSIRCADSLSEVMRRPGDILLADKTSKQRNKVIHGTGLRLKKLTLVSGDVIQEVLALFAPTNPG